MKTKIKEILCKEQNSLTENITAGFFIVLSLLVMIICVKYIIADDIWYDEVFSLKFAENSYTQIASLTASDVHPPFYYWYLKAFQTPGSFLFAGKVSPIVLAKAASAAPFVGLWIYAFLFVRKRMGVTVMGVFLFFVTAMPQMANYIVEIRMYSLALFFITAVFLHSYEIVLENKMCHWAALIIYGILTAYTQYYACVAVIAVYVALFCCFLFMKEKKRIMRLLACALVSVLAYLPWMPSFINQLKSVSESYWIPPLTFRSIFGCLKYIFLPTSYDTTRNYILAVIMIVLVTVTFFYGVWKEKSIQKRYLLICGFFIPAFTAYTGFVFSALNRPIFIYRYLIPGLGAMWLSAAYGLISFKRERLALLLLIPFLLAGHSGIKGFYAEENKKLEAMQETESFLESVPEDAVILCNFNHVQAVTAYYLENENLLYGSEPEALIQKLLPNCKGFTDTDKLKEIVEKENVYFLGSFDVREELVEEWKQDGITYTGEQSCLLERYWFNVYHLSVK